MKKFIMFALLFSVSSLATSPYRGPYLNKLIGYPKEGEAYQCRITPGVTVISKLIDGERICSTSKENSLEWQNMEGLIRDASKKGIVKAPHIVETIPNVSITAGQFMKVDNFTLFFDGAALETRKGTSAKQLVGYANSECSDMMTLDCR